MSTHAKWIAAALALPSLFLFGPESRAEEARDVVFNVEAKVIRERPTLARPMKLDFKGDKARLVTPIFTREGLFATAPKKLHGLGKYEGDVSHEPVYDPSIDAWFAWSNGMIVEVKPDGSLPVVVEDPPGHDFDIRVSNGLAVFRDPNRNEIVLMRLDTNEKGERERTVLHTGIEFFNPRFSPGGDKIVVSRNQGRDDRLFVTEVMTRRVSDVGVGYQPTWSPDGKTLYFMDFENDGLAISESRLYARDLSRGVTTKIFESREVIATQPAISRDGRSIAFFDEAAMDVAVAELPTQEVR